MARLKDLLYRIVVDDKDAVRKVEGFERKAKEAFTSAQIAGQGFRKAFDSIASTGQKVFFAFQGIQTLAGPFAQLAQSADQFESSARKLSATAKLTGNDFAFLTTTAQNVKEQFRLNTIQANEFTIALTKLTQKAGDTSKTGDAIARLLDIAAAQGLDANQALTAINQAILGIDEGTDKLFQKNPSVIYAEYAAQIGTTAGKLTDQQKAQALLNEVLTKGLIVQGQYNEFLKSDAGRKAQAAARAEELQATMGKLVNSVMVPLMELTVPIAESFVAMSGGMQQMTVVSGGLLIAGVKLISVFKTLDLTIKILGVSINTALGWIGLIISAASLLFVAWKNNLGGIQSKLEITWKFLQAWVNSIWTILKNLADRVALVFSNIGEILLGALTFDTDRIKAAFSGLTAAIVSDWSQSAENIKSIWRNFGDEVDRINREASEKVTTGAPIPKQIASPGPLSSTSGGVAITSISPDELEALDAAAEEAERIRREFRETDEDETEAYLQRQADRVEKFHNQRIAREQEMQSLWQGFLRQNALVLDTLENGWDSFWQSLTDTSITGSQRLANVWNGMKSTFISALGEMVKADLAAAAKRLLVHSQTETAKTAITSQSVAARVAVTIAGLAQEIGAVLKSVGVFLAQAAAKLVSFFASLGPVGLLAGLGSIPALIAAARAVIKSVGVFAEGGIATRPTLGLFAETGVPEAAIPLNERGAKFMAQLLPQLPVTSPQTTADFETFARVIAAEIRNVRIEFHNVLSGQQFLRKEFPRYQKIESARVIR